MSLKFLTEKESNRPQLREYLCTFGLILRNRLCGGYATAVQHRNQTLIGFNYDLRRKILNVFVLEPGGTAEGVPLLRLVHRAN